MTLLGLILIPAVFAVLTAFAPAPRAKSLAMWGTVLPLAWWAYAAWMYPWLAGDADQLTWSAPWYEPLGFELSLGADTVSMLLIGLTVLLGPIVVACSFTAVNTRVRTYYSWILAGQAAMTGVFAARDVLLFYVFFEFTLVPLYVLISLYGSGNRKKAATKFFLFTFTGSLLTLAGILYVAWFNATQLPAGLTAGSGGWSLDLRVLEQAASRYMSPHEQAWVFWAFMAGFAVKVPLFPVHTWLPLAHTEAPTAGSVVLAGVLLKLGTYGMWRFAVGYTPTAAVEYAGLIAVLAIVGILYGGLICWVQRDVKKLVAYSSVSHLGFCVLGLFSLTSIGVTGSVLYMLNHGLSTGALFLLIGMIYERYHTRDMGQLGGLARRMPVWGTFMVFFAMASVGLPGLNGFVSEFMCLLGTFQSGDWHVGAGLASPNGLGGAGVAGDFGPWFAFFGGLGMIVAAMYLLYMVGRIVWGKLMEPGDAHGHVGGHGSHGGDEGRLPTDLTGREIAILAPLAALCLLLGLYPQPVLRVLEAPTHRTAEIASRARAGTLLRPIERDEPAGDELEALGAAGGTELAAERVEGGEEGGS